MHFVLFYKYGMVIIIMIVCYSINIFKMHFSIIIF